MSRVDRLDHRRENSANVTMGVPGLNADFLSSLADELHGLGLRR
jgi:hypothetical protein